MHANSSSQHALAKPPLPEQGGQSGYANKTVTKVPGWHGIIAWDALLNGMAMGLFLAAAVSGSEKIVRHHVPTDMGELGLKTLSM